MITGREAFFIGTCLEWFFYGKKHSLSALTCTLANEFQLFPGLGLYTGIFVLYLQCSLQKTRSSIIVFYTLCLLYILSTVTVVSDLVALILEVSNNSICKNIVFYQLCSHVSEHYHPNLKSTMSQCYLTFRLSKSQQAVVVTSLPNVSWYA